MIKFFRKIRQRLITENRLGKYLLYAIGEIVLVVIGIIIALQINNWNEGQKQLRLEQEYYCRLLEDAQLDKEQITYLTQLADERLVASNQALRLLLQDSVWQLEIGIQIDAATRAVYSDFKPNNSAFEDLKSGANLNIISDKKVIQGLNRYFNKVDELKSIIMVNGKRAVDLVFANGMSFENGGIQSSLHSGRFAAGLDEDLLEALRSKPDSLLSASMQKRLFDEVLIYIGTNTRQLELYGYMLEEITNLEELLQRKCESNDVSTN